MLQIYQFRAGLDEPAIREMFWEYLQWANGCINDEFGVNFDIQSMLEREIPDEFKPNWVFMELAI